MRLRSTAMRRLRYPRLVAGAAMVLLVTSCSGEPDGAPVSVPTAPTAVAAGGTGVSTQAPTSAAPVVDWQPDYANDAGEELQDFDYPDDPEPAESVVSTLCNLEQRYFEGLRSTSGGRAVVDDQLRTVLVGLSDLLASWDTLRSHYPEAVPDIDVAGQIHELWDEALLKLENEDPDAAQDAMDEAERLVTTLPDVAAHGCVS